MSKEQTNVVFPALVGPAKINELPGFNCRDQTIFILYLSFYKHRFYLHIVIIFWIF